MIANYEYYSNDYKGNDIEEEIFNVLSNRSEAIINSTIMYKQLIPYETIAIKNAICAQIEYLASSDYKQQLLGIDRNSLQSESYPDYSYQFSNKNLQAKLTVNGIAIAPMACIYLQNAGLMFRGTDYVV